MLKMSYAGCQGLSSAISAQFTLKMSVAARNRKKITKNLYIERSRSSTLTPIKCLSLLLAMMCSIYVSICNHFHTIRANNGKIASF